MVYVPVYTTVNGVVSSEVPCKSSPDRQPSALIPRYTYRETLAFPNPTSMNQFRSFGTSEARAKEPNRNRAVVSRMFLSVIAM